MLFNLEHFTMITQWSQCLVKKKKLFLGKKNASSNSFSYFALISAVLWISHSSHSLHIAPKDRDLSNPAVREDVFVYSLSLEVTFSQVCGWCVLVNNFYSMPFGF